MYRNARLIGLTLLSLFVASCASTVADPLASTSPSAADDAIVFDLRAQLIEY